MVKNRIFKHSTLENDREISTMAANFSLILFKEEQHEHQYRIFAEIN
jgi:hypothetical protein